MLQCVDDKIIEIQGAQSNALACSGGNLSGAALIAQNYAGSAGGWYRSGLGGYVGGSFCWPTPTIYWNSYPVYVCSDKTAKAIEILKKLQAEKQLEVKSVARFIELVEMIAGIL